MNRTSRYVLAGAVLLSSSALLAQSGLPSASGDSTTVFNSAGPSDLLNGYMTASLNWVSALHEIVNALFWALASIDFVWTCITLVLQHSDLQAWFAGFIRKILTIGMFAVLLENGPDWTTDIVNFFINLGAVAGGRPVTDLSASGILGNGVELAGHMLHGAASVAADTNASPIGLLVGGLGSFAPSIILALGAGVIVLAFVVIALQFVMAMVEAYVVIGAGYVFLDFGGSRWTVPYTEKYFGMVVSAGLKIMVLELIIGMGSTMVPLWRQTADNIAKVPDIFSGGTVDSTWTGVQLEFGLVASILIFALLCWSIPRLAASVASGGLSMSAGDAFSAGSAAATAAFAGASSGSGYGPSSSGVSSDVAQIAQAAAMRGGEVGITAASVAATGGGAGAGVAANDLLSQELSGRGIVVPAPDSLGFAPQDSPFSPAVPSSRGYSPGSKNPADAGQITRNLHNALNKMPGGGADINGPTPNLGHDEL